MFPVQPSGLGEEKEVWAAASLDGKARTLPKCSGLGNRALDLMLIMSLLGHKFCAQVCNSNLGSF